MFGLVGSRSGKTGQSGHPTAGAWWRMEYNLRALVWEALGLTLTEFCEAWASGALDAKQVPEIVRMWDLLASAAVAPPDLVPPPRRAAG